MKKRVLVVEDDPTLAMVLRDNLAMDGFEVAWTGDGHEAINKARAFSPHLVILDAMLPGRSGFDILGLLRQGGDTPVIMLTALGQRSDKLRGLGLGADDYVTKPFDLEELLARVHAVLRRASPELASIVLGDVTIDFHTMTARRGDVRLRLTRRQIEFLRYLAYRQAKVVYRDELLREVWGYPDVPNTRSVDNAVLRLRKRIEPDPRHPVYIHTVHGDGYYLTPDPDKLSGPGPAAGPSRSQPRR